MISKISHTDGVHIKISISPLLYFLFLSFIILFVILGIKDKNKISSFFVFTPAIKSDLYRLFLFKYSFKV